ncbi:MAG: hypothetical protein ACKPKO_26245 [Candidatus Fonsibacter sp.]
MDMIIPVGICLRKNKRLKSNKDKETLNIFKQDILDDSAPVSKTIGRYFTAVLHSTT